MHRTAECRRKTCGRAHSTCGSRERYLCRGRLRRGSSRRTCHCSRRPRTAGTKGREGDGVQRRGRRRGRRPRGKRKEWQGARWTAQRHAPLLACKTRRCWRLPRQSPGTGAWPRHRDGPAGVLVQGWSARARHRAGTGSWRSVTHILVDLGLDGGRRRGELGGGGRRRWPGAGCGAGPVRLLHLSLLQLTPQLVQRRAFNVNAAPSIGAAAACGGEAGMVENGNASGRLLCTFSALSRGAAYRASRPAA